MTGDLVGHLMDEFEHYSKLWAEIWVAGMADLSRWMNERGVSPDELATAAGVRKSAITKLLRSQPEITALTITKLALALRHVPKGVAWVSLESRVAEVRGYSAHADNPLPDFKGNLLATIDKHMDVHLVGEGSETMVVTPFLDHRNDGISYCVEPEDERLTDSRQWRFVQCLQAVDSLTMLTNNG